eukprot:1398120-Pleurochrysis_carterae.AAC.1
MPWSHACEARYGGVGLFHDHAIGVSAEAAEEERDAPEGATVAAFLVRVRLIAESLVRARGPGEHALPSSDVQEGSEVADIVYPRHL